MNIDDITNLIQNLGFPICMVLGMGYFIVKYVDKLIQTFQDYIKEEKETTAQKYKDAKDERDREYELQKKQNESLQKITETQLQIIEMLKK